MRAVPSAILCLTIPIFLAPFSPLFASQVTVNFDRPLQIWDGSGVNYVETSQTRQYRKWHQDYGRFSTRTENRRQEILDANRMEAPVPRHRQWVGGDPNPGTPFLVDDRGNFKVRRGYYLYKQFTRAGHPGMSVASVSSDHDSIGAIAFAANKTKNADAFIVFDKYTKPTSLKITITGTRSTKFSLFRTWERENYTKLPDVSAKDGEIIYRCPPESVSTFFGN